MPPGGARDLGKLQGQKGEAFRSEKNHKATLKLRNFHSHLNPNLLSTARAEQDVFLALKEF
jgi:hypothetical protein